MSHDHLPAHLRDFIGKDLGAKPAAIAVEEGAIRHWCEVFQDGNPLFLDEGYAKRHGMPGLVLPPCMMETFMRSFSWPPQPDHETITEHLHEVMGLPLGVVVETSSEFYKPVHQGDRLTSKEVVTDISEEKTTRLGTGRFWDLEVSFFNQRQELVGKTTMVRFNYRLAEGK